MFFNFKKSCQFFSVGMIALFGVSCQDSLSTNSGEQVASVQTSEISASENSKENADLLSAINSSPLDFDNLFENPILAPMIDISETETASLTGLPAQCNSQADIAQYIQARSELSNNDFSSNCGGNFFYLTNTGYGPTGCRLGTPYSAIGNSDSRILLTEKGVSVDFLGEPSHLAGVVTGDNYFVGRAIVKGNSGQCAMTTIRGIFVSGTTQSEINSQINAFFNLPLSEQYDRIYGELLGSVVVAVEGDMDGDGDVDIDDIDSYKGKIGQAANSSTAKWDLNEDGQITLEDLEVLVTEHVETSNGRVGTFLGDVNLDGRVDVLGDAFRLVANLNNQVSSYADGDVNLDGRVSVLRDGFIITANLGRSN